MRLIHFDINADLSFLAAFHAALNALCAIVLLLALYFIRQKDIRRHRQSINLAMLFSFFFLLSYVLYHVTQQEVKYCRFDWTRGLYLFLLITHIILAGISLPFIFLTYIRGYFGEYKRHVHLSRWVWYVWFYVAVSGPICYLMLQPCR